MLLRSTDFEKLRHFYGLTQLDLAKQLDISQTYVNLIEKDKRVLTESVSTRVMTALNINASKLSDIRRLYEQIEASRQDIRNSG